MGKPVEYRWTYILKNHLKYNIRLIKKFRRIFLKPKQSDGDTAYIFLKRNFYIQHDLYDIPKWVRINYDQ
mgnify:FL=1